MLLGSWSWGLHAACELSGGGLRTDETFLRFEKRNKAVTSLTLHGAVGRHERSHGGVEFAEIGEGSL